MYSAYLIRICSLLILLTTFVVSIHSQDLKSRLKDKSSLDAIMQEIDKAYAGQGENWKGPDGSWPKMKHWKRWEWYQSGRLGPNHEFTDINKRMRRAHKALKANAEKPSNRSINSHWTSEGPNTTNAQGIGRADRIAFHPANPNLFYVGTPNGGLWRTTNGGSNWTPLTDHLPSLGVSGVVVDWSDPSDIYILTGDGDSDLQGGFVENFGYGRKSIGVMRSLDGGATWAQRGILDTLPFLPFDLKQSPTDAATMLAATNLGVFQTTNFGATWNLTLSDTIFDVQFKPGSNRVYAASLSNLFYSSDGGASWDTSELNVLLDEPKRVELAVTPADPNQVYAFIGGVDTSLAAGNFDGVYRSMDNGLTYAQGATTPNILSGGSNGETKGQQAAYDLALAVSTINPNTIITGGVRAWRSENGGNGYLYISDPLHSDVHDLAYNPLDNKLYACTDGGVYVSDDDGSTWTALWDGFRTSQLYHLAGTTQDDEYLLGGFQDNGVKLKYDNTLDWFHARKSDGFDVSFYPNDKTKFYASVNRKVYRFEDSGNSDTEITPPGGDTGGNYDWFGTVRAHVSNPSIVIVGYDSVFVSATNGDSWINTGASGSWALETCPSNENRIYAAGATSFRDNPDGGTLWRTDNVGLSWDSLHANPGFPNPNTITKITDIAVSPTNASNIIVTIGGFTEGTKVYRSTNAGNTWTNWSGGLPNIPINCSAIASGGTDYYIGTDLGIFYRNVNMNDWMHFSNGMPNVPVTELVISDNQNKIHAATFGRGVWQSTLAGNCVENLFFAGQLIGNYHYEAHNLINATVDIKGGLGTNVNFKAGQRVMLLPGFIANRHTTFVARIGGCGEGG